MKIEHLQEAGLARIHDKMLKHSVGIISAFRGAMPYSANMENHLGLKSQIRAMGYQVIGVKGSYIENYGSEEAQEVNEKSLFVVNPEEGDDDDKLKNDLRMLGKQYNQDAILSKRYGESAYVIGTSEYKHAYPSYNEYVRIGNPKLGKANEFFTKIKKRPFTFE